MVYYAHHGDIPLCYLYHAIFTYLDSTLYSRNTTFPHNKKR